MEKRITDFFRGYVRIRIAGNHYDRFLNLCAYHDIGLWNLLPVGEAYEAFIARKDFKKLKTIVRKSHAAVKITERYGLFVLAFRAYLEYFHRWESVADRRCDL